MNDLTVEALVKQALSHASAGAQPSRPHRPHRPLQPACWNKAWLLQQTLVAPGHLCRADSLVLRGPQVRTSLHRATCRTVASVRFDGRWMPRAVSLTSKNNELAHPQHVRRLACHSRLPREVMHTAAAHLQLAYPSPVSVDHACRSCLRSPGHHDPLVHCKVCLGLLRPVPRRTGLGPAGSQPDSTDTISNLALQPPTTARCWLPRQPRKGARRFPGISGPTKWIRGTNARRCARPRWMRLVRQPPRAHSNSFRLTARRRCPFALWLPSYYNNTEQRTRLLTDGLALCYRGCGHPDGQASHAVPGCDRFTSAGDAHPTVPPTRSIDQFDGGCVWNDRRARCRLQRTM